VNRCLTDGEAKRMTAPKRGLTNEQFAWLLIIPLLIFAVGIVAYPLGYSFWLSLNKINFAIGMFEFDWFGQYATFLKDPNAAYYTLTSLRFTAESVVLCMGLGLAMALVLNEAFPGRRLVRVTTLLPWAVSEFATAVIWRYMYNPDLGIITGMASILGLQAPGQIITSDNAVECLSIAYSWHFSPLIAFFLLSGLQTVPEELYRAAKIDGAGALRRFWSIILPHLRYAILVSLVLITLEAARAVDIILILTAGGPGIASETLTYHIFRESFINLNMGIGSAVSYILLIIIVAIAIVYFLLLTRKK